MKVNMMSWNTGLFKYVKNKKEKDGETQYQDYIKPVILEYLSHEEHSIVVVQEIPFKKPEGSWRIHKVYALFKRDFIENENYDVLCFKDNDEWHTKMTVVIATKDTIEKVENKVGNIDNNLYIPFKIKAMELECLALHAHDALEAGEKLSDYQRNGLIPSILIGDFNAGAYEKEKETKAFVKNKKAYLSLMKMEEEEYGEYIDLVQGKCTTTYNTAIDHILFRNLIGFQNPFDWSNCGVDTTVKGSDHYPIHCTITKNS